MDPDEEVILPAEEEVGMNIKTVVTSWATNLRYKLSHSGSVHLNQELPAFILGRPISPSSPSLLQGVVLEEARKVPWCTYRKAFEPLIRRESSGEQNYFTSDVGWGCTLRVGQMVLLTAISRHLQLEASSIDLLAMISCTSSPFSIHQMVTTASKNISKQAGDWFSPSSVAHTLHYLVSDAPIIPDFTVSVAMDGGVFKDQVLADMTGLGLQDLICTCERPDSVCILCTDYAWRGTLLLFVPIMLGREKLAKDYFQTVKFLLEMPQSLGIIGGKRRSAVYFIGLQGDSLFYIDPHYVQKASKSQAHLLKHISTYQVRSL
jgi:cysteine protease ATG4